MSETYCFTADEKENIQNDYGCDFNTNSNYPVLHNHTFFELTFFFAVTTHHINGRICQVEENTLVLLRPADIHCLTDCETVLGHLNLKISCDCLQTLCQYIDRELYPALLEADDRQLSVVTPPEYGHRVRKALDEILFTSSKKQNIISCKFLVADFLRLLYDRLCNGVQKPMPKAVERGMKLLRDPSNFGANITELLSGLGYSYMQIYRLFKETAGRTPNAFFTEQKLLYAANLLNYTNYNIAQIANLCGFASQPRFDTAFKKYHGVSPREYRREVSRRT